MTQIATAVDQSRMNTGVKGDYESQSSSKMEESGEKTIDVIPTDRG